ncbi:MAG: MFS transporter [Pseudorhodoplanes sp.]|mgnify:CR=1 FL=1|nr:Riboflavin transporter RfnT [Pseudorhodoplanes sp.]MCL4711459.1 MFS transporter [Pseudorhodoplanes sp.]
MMSSSALPLTEEAGDRLARRNALVLAVTQALAGANTAVMLATGGIVGAMLAPDRSLATLPVTTYVIGMWFGTLPMGMLARRFGRRTAFQLATIAGVATGLLCCLGVVLGSFGVFCTGAFCCGLYAAGHQGYRFAAADTASDKFRPKAISWVLIGGVFAGVVGPQLIILTKDMWQPFLFAASYLAQAAVAVVATLVLGFLRIPRTPKLAEGESGRSLIEILRQPRFFVAVVCGIASYAMMNMVMTAAPLAMVECNHSVTDATLGLQWHVIGMYAPSFFTGGLIMRYGVERVIAAGFALILVSAAVSIAGITVWHFWIGLVLLGVGWNFGFIGATAMVTQCHRPHERTRVQSFNDFLVFGSMAVGSFASGNILVWFGWAAVNEVVFPIVLAAGALLLWLALRERRRAV